MNKVRIVLGFMMMGLLGLTAQGDSFDTLSRGSDSERSPGKYEKHARLLYDVAKDVNETGDFNRQKHRLANYAAGRSLGRAKKWGPRWLRRSEVSLSFDEDKNNETLVDYSFLTVVPLIETGHETVFSQFRVASYEPINGDARMMTNVGFGARKLSEDYNTLIGINAFIDYEVDNGHTRFGPGFEIKHGLMDFTANYYDARSGVKKVKIDGIEAEERALNGYDIETSYPLPYLAWTRAYLQYFHYDTVKMNQPDVEGLAYRVEMQLSPSFRTEIGYQQETTRADDGYDRMVYEFSIQFPPQRHVPTLWGKKGRFIADTAFGTRDLRHDMTKKVRRNNNIVIERALTTGIVVGGY